MSRIRKNINEYPREERKERKRRREREIEKFRREDAFTRPIEFDEKFKKE